MQKDLEGARNGYLAAFVGFFCALFSGVILSDVTQSAASPDAETIRSIRVASNEAIARRDVEAIVASIDSEYQITTGAGVFSRGGPAEEKKLWSDHFKEYPDAVYVRTSETIELSAYLPLAAESGRWVGSYTTEKGIRNLNGRYLASWRNVDGQWKIHSELFVTLACEGAGC